MELSPKPGRLFLVGPDHTFKEFATAIDLAFARWDLAHLHEFEFPDGRRYGIPDDFYGQPVIDYSEVRVGKIVTKRQPFTYVFDFGDNWQHKCQVVASNVVPEELAGVIPQQPIPIWGWGTIPDQYGRRTEDDNGEDEIL
jgi:hypothetical protein